MWFDPYQYQYVHKDFDLKMIVNNPRCPWHGDQDYIYSKVKEHVAFYDNNRIISYRWQAKEGGYDFRYRKHHVYRGHPAYEFRTRELWRNNYVPWQDSEYK